MADAQDPSCLSNKKQKILYSLNGSYLKRGNIHVEKRGGNMVRRGGLEVGIEE
jgi:hypothetical protein